MAAARQKEIKVNITVVATKTLTAGRRMLSVVDIASEPEAADPQAENVQDIIGSVLLPAPARYELGTPGKQT